MKFSMTGVAATLLVAMFSTGAIAGVDRAPRPGAVEPAGDAAEALYDAHLGVRTYWHQGPVGTDRPSRRAGSERRDQAATATGSRIR